ncbi:MAG: metallophosphoesterase, partial [Leptonema sp. (in: Bacteria)]|nr:metallophosphoesterase [Leptonema sp. (in: bacteria)]
MRLIYITDIHDALKELRQLLLHTEADLYLFSGDILYHAFYDEAKVYDFVCLQEELYSFAKQIESDLVPYDLATEILRSSEGQYASEMQLKAAEYRLLFHRASRTMKEKYSLIEDLIQKYSDASTFVLPGNYDIDLRYTALSARNLHKNTMYFGDLTFAGYGGAPIATSGIPEKLAVPYQEAGSGDEFYSEPYDFFIETQPDILVLHNPAYGYFDRISTKGHIGSSGIRNYLDDNFATLVLSGHIHEDYGVLRKNDGTIFLNPSNFGKVDSSIGFEGGGMFAEILIEPSTRQVHQINLNRLKDGKVCRLLLIEVVEDQLKATPLDDADES